MAGSSTVSGIFSQRSGGTVLFQGIGQSVARALDERILRRGRPRASLHVGSILALPIDVTEPLADVLVPPGVDRVNCFVSWRTQFIGTVTLPVIGAGVFSAVLADAIANLYCWPLMGAYFNETVYSGLHFEVLDGRASVHRDRLHLCTWHSTTADARAELHDRVGWTVFLQELWGCYDWDGSQFDKDNRHTCRRGLQAGCSASLDASRNTGANVNRRTPAACQNSDRRFERGYARRQFAWLHADR